MGKTGLALPFSANGRGGLALVDGDDQLAKIIGLGLNNLDSENPFNEQENLGLGDQMIFAVNDNALQAALRRSVLLLFRRLQLENRAQLSKGSPTFTIDKDTQTLTMHIKYINLETNKPEEFNQRFGPDGTGALARGSE